MQKVYSVGQINTYIRNMFTQDFVLNRVSVRGEISNLKYHTSGHIYFTLKDASAAIACVMFAGARGGLAFRMSNGQQVVVDGAGNVYERDGIYQLYATKMRQDGAGELYEKFLELKEELEEMGMFAPEYKQPIPKFVRRLGVVTASTGAAIRDIINIATRRNPGIRIILYPAKVQGEGAAESVAAGLAALDALGVDVIIVGRGGGSLEDLWAFNEETVARAIFSCHTPVISAVGHETDTTIADFVADLRAPTPSAAAELAVADVTAWLQALDEDALQLQRIMQRMIKDARSRLRECELRMRYAKPQQRLMQQKQRLDEYEERLRRAMQSLLEQTRHQLALSEERLRRLSPYEKLESGYGCILTEDGRRIRSVSQVAPGEVVQICLADGRMTARIQEVKETKIDGGKT